MGDLRPEAEGKTENEGAEARGGPPNEGFVFDEDMERVDMEGGDCERIGMEGGDCDSKGVVEFDVSKIIGPAIEIGGAETLLWTFRTPFTIFWLALASWSGLINISYIHTIIITGIYQPFTVVSDCRRFCSTISF